MTDSRSLRSPLPSNEPPALKAGSLALEKYGDLVRCLCGLSGRAFPNDQHPVAEPLKPFYVLEISGFGSLKLGQPIVLVRFRIRRQRAVLVRVPNKGRHGLAASSDRRPGPGRNPLRRHRLYGATTIRTLLADGLPKDASIEEQWLLKYSRPTKMKFVGVWDTVGSLGLPLGSTAAKVHRYRFLDTHLRLDNEYAFHALALDEHRHNFEPTFWTRTIKTGEGAPPDRPIEHVEQRWFVGAHANVGGGYASDPLAQRPLKWLMDKASALGLVFRDQVVIDTLQVAPPITDSYREFAYGFYRFISRPFYRPVGLAPDQGTKATTARINETIDGSVFDRWRADADYRPANLTEWAKAKGVDPDKLIGAVRAADHKIGAP